jgi:HEAT repeat protein
MKTMKTVSVLAVFLIAQALTLGAQTPAAKPEAKKPAPAAAQPAAKPAAPQDPLEAAKAKLKSKDAAERRQGADMIGQSRDPKGAAALMSALSDDSPRVRQAAADALGLLAWREASPKLCDLLLKDKDASVRQQAASSLSLIMDQGAGPSLIKALGDSEPSVRYAALHTISVLRYAPAEDQVRELLEAGDSTLRRSAIAALGRLQSKKSGPAIVAALKDADPLVIAEAIKAIGVIPYAEGASELVKLLDAARQPALRVEAALALSKLGRNDGLLTAYEFLKSPELSIRSQAMTVAGDVGDARSLQLIEEMYAAEQDPANKAMLDFTRQRLQARLKPAQK